MGGASLANLNVLRFASNFSFLKWLNSAIICLLRMGRQTLVFHLFEVLMFLSEFLLLRFRCPAFKVIYNVWLACKRILSLQIIQEFFQISGSSNVRNESVVQHAALSGVSSLDQKWQYLLSKSLADSTQKTYCSAQKCFVEFCIQFSLFNRNGSVLPAFELTILRFIGVLSERRQPSTIRTYLSAVRSLHIIHGFSDPLIGSCRIPMALKGAKRVNA